MKIFLAGNWVDRPKKFEVKNPFDNSVIDTVPRADGGDLEKVLAFAERGAKVMAKLSSYVVLGTTANTYYQDAPLGNLAVGSSADQLEKLIDKVESYFGSGEGLNYEN